jgi:hypothetical protein
VVRTFAEAVLGVFVGSNVTLGSAHWGLILDAAGTAALLALLASVVAKPVTGSASFLIGPKAKSVVRTRAVTKPGKHEAV